MLKILLLSHSFNSLTQRLFCELEALGHTVSVELDIADSVTEEALGLFQPDLLLAPYLRRAIPASVWQTLPCLVVHPGILGDRGPSALDRARQEERTEWGVTVLQANAEMDAGDIWASVNFPMRAARKGSLYRHEVTEAACEAVKAALQRFPDFQQGRWHPQPQSTLAGLPGQPHVLMRQEERRIDWEHDDTRTVLAKIQAADGFPGVRDRIFGQDAFLFDAWPESTLRGQAGAWLAQRETALCRATRDGAVWMGHLKFSSSPAPFKLPATAALRTLGEEGTQALQHIPVIPLEHPVLLPFPPPSSPPPSALSLSPSPTPTWQDISYREETLESQQGEPLPIGRLRFEFYNGAMGPSQCQRLQQALDFARQRPTLAIVLEGGEDFWSNGLHLNLIEAADALGSTPAEASWEGIQAMNDLTLALINTTSHLTLAALRGNCGAGGCFLARACDLVWARDGVLLNPHYKNMGNLYGSEYWTYLLPRRVGLEKALAIMQNRLPLTAQAAHTIGLIDAHLPREGFESALVKKLVDLASLPGGIRALLEQKERQRLQDEAEKPLASYREQELEHMQRNFYGFDPSYHVARYHFVLKSPVSWTPRHLARHRDAMNSAVKYQSGSIAQKFALKK